MLTLICWKSLEGGMTWVLLEVLDFSFDLILQEENNFLCFPLGGVFPWLGAYILCPFSISDLHGLWFLVIF